MFSSAVMKKQLLAFHRLASRGSGVRHAAAMAISRPSSPRVVGLISPFIRMMPHAALPLCPRRSDRSEVRPFLPFLYFLLALRVFLMVARWLSLALSAVSSPIRPPPQRTAL